MREVLTPDDYDSQTLLLIKFILSHYCKKLKNTALGYDHETCRVFKSRLYELAGIVALPASYTLPSCTVHAHG
jgi:hypothetical protein